MNRLQKEALLVAADVLEEVGLDEASRMLKLTSDEQAARLIYRFGKWYVQIDFSTQTNSIDPLRFASPSSAI